MNFHRTISVFILLLYPFLSMLHAQVGYSSASLSMGKQVAQQKRIPLPDEVRVEEYLNYHRHQIPLPRDGESVGLDLSWGTPAVDDGSQALLQIGLCTREATRSEMRPALNLTLVIDRSGSMQGEKMAKTREALSTFVRQLAPGDQVALVVFDHEAAVWVPAQPVGEGHALREAIGRLEARGSTDLNAGIIMGYQEVLKNFAPWQTNRLLILTDALTNTGELDPRTIVKNTRFYDQDKMIDYVLVGVGEDFNTELSRKLTDQEQLTLHFIHDAEDIRKVFEDEVSSLLAPVAKEVWMEIRYPESWEGVTLFGYQAEVAPGRIRLPIRNINAGLTQVLLLGFSKQERYSQGAIEVELGYFDLGEQRSLSRHSHTVFPARVARDGEVAKNHSIAFMAQAMKDMAWVHSKGETAKATADVEKAIKEVYRAFPKGLDTDQKRIMDILEAYQKDLVVFLDRG